MAKKKKEEPEKKLKRWIVQVVIMADEKIDDAGVCDRLQKIIGEKGMVHNAMEARLAIVDKDKRVCLYI